MYRIIVLLLTSIYTTCAFSKVVSLPLREIPSSVDTLNLKSVSQNRIASLMSKKLISVTDGFEFIPSLAEKYWWSKDGKKLFLKVGAERFSDGSEIRSSDIISSLKRCVLASEKTLTSMFKYLEGYENFIKTKGNGSLGIKVSDPKVIELSFIKKTPLILENLSHNSCSILKNNGETDLISGAISPGAYTLKEYSKSLLVLERSKYLVKKNKAPLIVNFVATPNFSDVTSIASWSDMLISKEKRVDLMSKFNKYDYSFLGTWQISFNNSSTKVSKLEIRKAISIGLNKRKLARALEWSESRLQSGLIPFGMKGFKRDDLSNYNPEKAMMVLRKLGYTKKRPLKLKLLVKQRGDNTSSNELWNKVFALDNLILEVTSEKTEAYNLSKNKFEFDMLFHGKAPGSMEPQILLNTYSSKSIFNTSNIADRSCDNLIESSSTMLDSTERYITYKKAEKCLLNNYVVIPLSSVGKKYLYLKKPWSLSRNNQFLLYPYKVNEWRYLDE